MNEYKEFTCPKCGGHRFGSDLEKNTSGQTIVGKMVTCQSVISSRYIGLVLTHRYCGYRCTRKEGGL